MRKNIKSMINISMYTVFILWSIVTFLIIFKDMDGGLAIKLVIGYVIYLFLLVGYMLLSTIINIKKLKFSEIKKRFIKFIILFMFFALSNYTFDYFFRPEKVDLFRQISIAFSVALGFSFLDLAFINNKKGQDDYV